MSFNFIVILFILSSTAFIFLASVDVVELGIETGLTNAVLFSDNAVLFSDCVKVSMR